MQDVPLPQGFLPAAMGNEIAQVPPGEAKKPTPFAGPQQMLAAICRNLETHMSDLAEMPDDLVINHELRFAYSPLHGRLWRTDGAGTPIRELTLWRWDEDRGQVKIGTIRVGGKYKMMTHVIHYIMTSEWPAPGMYIDHKKGRGT
jgi:hypothetical protein